MQVLVIRQSSLCIVCLVVISCANRILGCLSRPDCVKLKQTYARMGYKRTLEEAFRSVLRSQATYLTACLMLISEDTSITPLGSDKEIDEEELELQREADRIAATDMLQYDSVKVCCRR